MWFGFLLQSNQWGCKHKQTTVTASHNFLLQKLDFCYFIFICFFARFCVTLTPALSRHVSHPSHHLSKHATTTPFHFRRVLPELFLIYCTSPDITRHHPQPFHIIPTLPLVT